MRLAAVAIERDGAGTQGDREREEEREKGGEMASNASTELVITAR